MARASERVLSLAADTPPVTDLTDRAAGCLLGLACGDALGRPVEGYSSAGIAADYGRLTEMRGRGVHGRSAGTVTDDTAMTLRLARSLADRGGFDGTDIAARYVDWYASDPQGIGSMTAETLGRIQGGAAWDEAGPAVHVTRPEGENAGNGSLMRAAPLALAFRTDHDALVDAAVADSRITHADPRCVESCVAFVRILAGLLDGDQPGDALDAGRSLAVERDAPGDVRTALAAADDAALAELETTGYVIHTLETALHDGLTADDPEGGIVAAVNRGGDADTIGAVTGALVGARFGAGALSPRWVNELDDDLAVELRSLGERLVEG
jgi:ADP-ribosyl-[dinitrogen reductase] hydrolase